MDGYTGYTIAEKYRVRFIRSEDEDKLLYLWRLSKGALSGEPCGKWERMQWASKWFAKENPYVSHTGAYKDLDGLLR